LRDGKNELAKKAKEFKDYIDKDMNSKIDKIKEEIKKQ